jgi:uncharacterized protein YggE
MKKLIIIANIFLFTTTVNAQQVQPIFTNNPFPKTITVSGSAEMDIIPDEIYVNVELKEYQKKGENKKDLETIKTQFLDASKSVGIADSLISIVSYTGDNPYFWKKRKKDPDLFTSITYQLKFKTSELMDKLVEKLDDDATQSFLIISTNHSKITEYRKQLKIAAVKAAKEKGIYLTEAVSERLGEAITIKEPNEFYPLTFGENVSLSNSLISNGYIGRNSMKLEDKDNLQVVDFKKMKLRFEVEVVFALK